MSEFEQSTEYRRQRFEAALKFATTVDSNDTFMTQDEAIQLADSLLAKLEETKPKT